MKVIGITSTAILSLFLGIAASAYAGQEQRDEKQDHPEQQQSKQQAKPESQHAQKQGQSEQKQQQHARQQEQDKNKQQEQAKQQDKNRQQQQQAQQKQNQNNHQPQRTQQQQRVVQSAWQQHGSQHWESDHRTWQQRGGYHGYRIPDNRFRGYFGPSHGFRMQGLPFLVVGGYPRFQYQGYWFSPVDPWPTYWGNDWYDNDDVYVNYVDNGYYLYNRRYPQQGIAINISL